MIAKSKGHEKELLDIDAKYEHDTNLMNNIYLFLKDMRLLKKNEDRKDQVMAFHKMLCLENDKFPDRVKYVDVYPGFLSFILKTDPDVKDTHEVKLIFNQYYAPKIREPEKKEYDHSESRFMPKISKADPEYVSGSIDGWPDEVLKHQYILMRNLLREEFNKKLDLKGSYTYKIVTEMKERGLLEDEVPSEDVPAH